ncbi:DUF3450 family protein [Haloferula rosea]|uniref:DUF3450 family protein n=1 Tax=Haloferula rosea TaxID=490093 RepID=A0A934REH3_9BACT|nr:DUF3450 family protein [Haloferula rosea]MBK1828178.1 DUF3450 family protein [Haloferula rosea]
MRALPLIIALLPGFSAISSAQEDGESRTEKLKDSVREWIETMREIQQEEDSWEQDRELLDDQRTALRTEIEQLTRQVAEAKVEKEGADKDSLDQEAKRDALVEAKELMQTEVRALEEQLVARLPFLPQPLVEDPRVKELMAQVRKDVTLKGDAAKSGLTKRLNNVLNVLSEAEKWQQTVHLKPELHETKDGKKLNMNVVYFGLGSAYAVDDSGTYAMVGAPTVEGWKFEERNELAPRVLEMVTVLNGDADAKFINLPIDLR